MTVSLRDMQDSDLDHVFRFQQDDIANQMAAFTAEDPSDRPAFNQHWAKIRANTAIILKTILSDDIVVGNLSHFEMFGEPSVGYWIDRAYWGQGIATEALQQFLQIITTRPLYARVAFDNIGSIRVLEKCGFVQHGTDTGFAYARSKEIDEIIMILNENNPIKQST